MRGISGKWNAMWHSSLSPKYWTTSAGHWFASASSTRSGKSRVDLLADPLEVLVRARQVLAVGAFFFEQIRDGVQPEAVDAELEPEPQRADHRVLDGRVLEVQVGLVAEEAVPVVLAAHRVEGPVRLLGVDEDDPRVAIPGVGVGPHVVVAVGTGRVGARGLEPRVLVAGVVHDEVGDDPHAALVGFFDELHEVAEVTELGQDREVVGDVVPAVAQR